mgnify:CR=1 FL=1
MAKVEENLKRGMMEKRWFKMQMLGLLLIIFVIWKPLIFLLYALIKVPPSQIIPFCKFSLFVLPKTGMGLSLGSIQTFAIVALVRGSQQLLRGLTLLCILMSVAILISGIGLLVRKKEMLKFTLYTAMAFAILNGLNLLLFIITKFSEIFTKIDLYVMVWILKQIIFTLFFAGIVFYFTHPKVKEQFK